MNVYINSKNKEVHSHQGDTNTETVAASVKDLNDDYYKTCEVKIKDCLPCLFELYQNGRFMPYMTRGLIHEGTVYKPPC